MAHGHDCERDPAGPSFQTTARVPTSRLEPMSTPKPREDLPIRRIDRILAFMSLGLLVLSILCFFAILIASSAHVKFDSGVWPVVGILVYIAPVIAFVLLLVVLISSFVRRARANKGR